MTRAHLTVTLAALAAALPVAAQAQAFSPGEETVLKVRYLGLPTGEGRITVGGAQGDVWPIIFQAKSHGVIGFLDIREHLSCYWDAAARLAKGSDLRAVELGDYHADTLRFDRTANTATVAVTRSSGRKEKVVEVPARAQDLTSAFLWLRLQPLAPGEQHQIPVLTGSKLFTLGAQVVGRERLETEAGDFDAVRLSVHIELAGNFSTRRDISMWFSDDPRHVLLKVEADVAVGSIVAEIKSYRPGSALAALP